jgi:broad specificity phosphatase PhoE
VDKQLLLVRHSLPEIRRGLPAREWHLSEDGRRRVVGLAERLIPYQPEIIVTSPEPKAKQTAEILAASLQLPVRMMDPLHEHERNSVPSLSRQEFEVAVHEFFEKPNILVFGSETADQAYERFSGAVNSILSESDNSKIAIVSHGTVISLFVSRLTGQAGFQLWSQLGLPSCIVLDMQSKKLIAVENIA